MKKLDPGLVIAWAVVAESAIRVLMPMFYGNFAIYSKFVDGTLTSWILTGSVVYVACRLAIRNVRYRD